MPFAPIARKWTGYFKYGKAYSLSHQLKRSRFELELNFTNLQFDGTCNDEYTQLFFDRPALVKGTIENRAIEFVKKYPALLTIDDNEQTTVDHQLPAVPIIYKGVFRKSWLRRRLYIKGTWTITSLVPGPHDSTITLTVGGKWKMWPSVIQ